MLAAAGVEAQHPDGFSSPQDAATAFAASGAPAAIICATDEAYKEVVPELAQRLRGHGASAVVLAGRPGEREQLYRDAGVDSFVFSGCDILQTLGEILDRIGVAR